MYETFKEFLIWEHWKQLQTVTLCKALEGKRGVERTYLSPTTMGKNCFVYIMKLLALTT